MTMSISEVAAATGLRPSALRYYEEVGLIRPVGRHGGRRHYDADVLSRLGFVALCQDVGFTIREITTLLDGRAEAKVQWQHMAERKQAAIDRQMEQLRTMQGHLRAALACACEQFEGCELVQDAAERRRVHRAVPPDVA